MNFVTYEIGKKLQEKGYPHGYNRFGYRPIYSDECSIKYLSDIGAYEEEYYGENIPCPTINEVLTWLREGKNIFIELEYINQNTCGCIIIEQKTGGLIAKWDFDKFQYAEKNPLVGNTYEEASLAGIKYCLDNLI